MTTPPKQMGKSKKSKINRIWRWKTYSDLQETLYKVGIRTHCVCVNVNLSIGKVVIIILCHYLKLNNTIRNGLETFTSKYKAPDNFSN